MTRPKASVARRATEIERNMQAAGFSPAERDGRSIFCDQRQRPSRTIPRLEVAASPDVPAWGVGQLELGVELMSQVRIGAVGYLNARPLTWALDRRPDRWHVRYDVPAVCAALLHDGKVDLGLIPSIEYLQSDEYRFVPGVGIGSRGPVASVALYTRRPVEEIRHIALDTSSRTSVTLIQVLCRASLPHQPEVRRRTVRTWRR